MARLLPRQVAMHIRSGPKGKGPVASVEEILELADKHPTSYDAAIRHLYYKMAEAAFRFETPQQIERHSVFVSPWIDQIDRDSSRFMIAGLRTYADAWKAGMGELSLESSPEQAMQVAAALDPTTHECGSFEELLTLVLRG